MRRTLAVGIAVLAAAAPGAASHQNGHLRPFGPAKVRFAADFPRLNDTEWSFPLGGFGGVRKGAPRKHSPVIFIHGNNSDHVDWYLVRDDFKAAGWNDQELWGLSYNGLGNDEGNTATRPNPEGLAEHREMAGDQIGRIANNDLSAVPDLYRFVMAVRAYTGSPTFSLVSHSLGVTVGRKMLKIHPELRGDLVAFVGIAGGNHGTSLCPPGTEGNVYACDEVAANTPWLNALNGPDGDDETYPPAKWMTVCECGPVYDVAFVGSYAKSPQLKGALNREYPLTSHNQLRVLAPIVDEYRRFIEAADRARAPREVLAIHREELPATGADLPVAIGGALLGLGGVLVALSRRRDAA